MAGNNEPRDERTAMPPGTEEPAARHEHKDVDAWAVGKFAIGLVLLCITSLGLLFGLFRFFESRDIPVKPSPSAGAGPDRLPPEPRLQETPVRDLKQMRAGEDQILGSYGWVDRQKGIVRLPIDRAIDLLAQRGLGARQAATPPSAAAAVSVPTESGLGEKMTPPAGEPVPGSSESHP